MTFQVNIYYYWFKSKHTVGSTEEGSFAISKNFDADKEEND